MSAVPIETVHVPGAPRIALDHAGTGEWVILLHGVGGNRSNWREQIAAFAPHFHAAAWDARGYGASDDYDGPLQMADFSADLARLLDFFAVAKAHLAGLSMGGLIAQDFVHRHPQRVASLVLADTGMGLRDGQEAWAESFLAARRAPLLAGKTPAEIAPALAPALLSAAAPPAVVARVVASLAALRTEPYLKALEVVTRFRNPLAHAQVRVPTLVVVGAEDTLTPPRTANALAGRIPGARTEIIEGAGHLSNVEQPAAFNRVVLDFLRAVAGAGGRGSA